MIVPFAPGGATDVIGRIVGDYLSRALRQQFVIENVAGAGGTTGTTRTMRASPDGHTRGPAMNALLGGQVDYICNVIPDTVHHVHSGTAKGYAITTAERSPALPNVPTTKEAGLPQFDASAWNALFAPKGTPKPVLQKLTDALDQALDDESVRRRLLDLGCDIPAKSARGPQQLAALVKSEIVRWTPIIKAASVKAQ